MVDSVGELSEDRYARRMEKVMNETHITAYVISDKRCVPSYMHIETNPVEFDAEETDIKFSQQT